ncbi:MAG: HD domain-containing protein [Deltaproteobacteria bacterium]|nr:HD domain-containing protein [Deltaproteobacteria bacterium]
MTEKGHTDSHRNRWRNWISVFEKELAVEMQKAPAPSEVHDHDHILRVLRRCIRLGEKLDADLEILVAAVYLHDLGRHYIEDSAHGALSEQKAKPVLERIDFPGKKREAVLHAIRVHDISVAHQDRTSLESKILYDADKIDTLGVVGILRYIRHYYGKKSIDFVLDDIEARWEGLALPETRDLALEDYEYIKDYFIELKEELGAAAWGSPQGTPQPL